MKKKNIIGVLGAGSGLLSAAHGIQPLGLAQVEKKEEQVIYFDEHILNNPHVECKHDIRDKVFETQMRNEKREKRIYRHAVDTYGRMMRANKLTFRVRYNLKRT